MLNISEYPKFLYRRGGADIVWGVNCEKVIVESITQEMSLLNEGFFTDATKLLDVEEAQDVEEVQDVEGTEDVEEATQKINNSPVFKNKNKRGR